MHFPIEPLVIFVFNLVLYFPTFFYSYVMDDTNLYASIKECGGARGYWGPWYNVFTRNPLRSAHRLYGCGTFGINMHVDHLVTFSLWNVLCILAYYAFGHNTISFSASLLLCCHPMMNQLSVWLNGRRYLVCAILLMASMLTWPFSVIFYLMSGLFQTTIFFAPVIFFNKCPWGIVALGALFLISKDWIFKRIAARAAMIKAVDLKEWQPGRPVVIVKIIGFYFWKMIFPGRVQMVYPFLQYFGRTKEGNYDAYKINMDFAGGCGACVALAAMVFFATASLRPWAVFMVLALLQWCGVVAFTQLIADRYSAIFNIFFCFFVSYFAFTYLPFAFAVGALCLVAGNYIYSLRQVLPMYKDIASWYDYHVFNDFGNIATITLRIGSLLSEKRLWQASALIELALQRNPNDYAINYLGYISAMIVQAPVIAQRHVDICRANMYLGEEVSRKMEVDDADLALRALRGELTIKMPQKKG